MFHKPYTKFREVSLLPFECDYHYGFVLLGSVKQSPEVESASEMYIKRTKGNILQDFDIITINLLMCLICTSMHQP
jgi:hypothetical protein